MVNSNNRKLALSGWLQENDPMSYGEALRLQKYLFFYEAFCKTNNEQYDFSKLKGYKRGPVFSTVWGDYTKDRADFDQAARHRFHSATEEIIDEYARRASFLVSALSEYELSQLTHKYHIWNAKVDQIMAGIPQVALDDSDFGQEDRDITKMIAAMFPDHLIKNSYVISINGAYFVFSRENAKKLTEDHMDTLSAFAKEESYHNPIFAEIDESGVLLLD